MEWARLGVQVVSMVYSSQTDEELHEVRRERDVYKKEAQCLKSHLRDVKRYSNANAYNSKPSTNNYKKDFNKGHPETSKRETTAHNQKQFTEKKSYGNGRGFGQQRNNVQSTQQSSSSSMFGFWGSSKTSSVKTNYNGSSNSKGSSGRGGYSHSRGRGGGQGSGRGGRGSYRK